MTTALIVLGVIAFLAIDALIIFMWLYRRHKAADDLGTIRVPGEATVALPAGKVKLTYHEAQKSSGDEHEIHFSIPAELQVQVRGGSTGDPLEIKGPGLMGMGSSKSTGPGFSRALIGTVRVPEPGVYTVSAQPELPGAVEPTVLVGE